MMRLLDKINTKYKYLLFVNIVMIFALLFVGHSYAKYIIEEKQVSSHVGVSDCFKLEFSDGDSIQLNNATPLLDSEINDLVPYTFTLKNVCNHKAAIDINLEELNDSTMDLRGVKYKINDDEIKILGNINLNENTVTNNALTSRTIKFDEINPNEEKIYNLKIWVDYDSTIEQTMNKVFDLKLVIVSSNMRDDKKRITVDTNGSDTGVFADYLKIGLNDNYNYVPQREGYTFLGWYDKLENGNKVIDYNQSFELGEYNTIYAHWEESKNEVLDYNKPYNSDGYRFYSQGNSEQVLLEYDSNYIIPQNIDLEFRCGNKYALKSSTCHFKVYGYRDDMWENIVTKSGSRNNRVADAVIFKGNVKINTDKVYSKFKVSLTSDDQQARVYASIKVN